MAEGPVQGHDTAVVRVKRDAEKDVEKSGLTLSTSLVASASSLRVQSCLCQRGSTASMKRLSRIFWQSGDAKRLVLAPVNPA